MSTPITFSPPITISVDATGKLVVQSQGAPPPALAVTFGFTPAAALIGQPVNFTATTIGGVSPFIYGWNFGDGTSGTGGSVMHTYATPGTFNINLAVTDATGTIAAASSQTIVITAGVLPLTATFTETPATPTVGQAVAFTATAAGGVAPYTYGWNFGDGSTGTGLATGHNYAAAGTFTVNLTVTDTAGTTVTATKTITVVVAGATNYILKYDAFDYDGGGEVTLAVNGRTLANLPATDSPQNAQVYIPMSLDITRLVVQGANTLRFAQRFDFSGMRNLQIVDQAGNIVFSDPTDRRITGTQTFTYNFNTAGGPPPPNLKPATLTIAASTTTPAAGASVTVTGTLTSAGIPIPVGVVNLQQSTDGITWSQTGTTTSDTAGNYSLTTSFANGGTYQIRTSFPGM